MDTPKPPSFVSIIPSTLLLSLIGWGGLYTIITQTLPTLGPRWLFFFLVVVGVTGTSLPIVYFFNRRFPSTPPAEIGVILRQAIWVGVYGASLVWLQLGRMLNPTVAGILAGVLMLVEALLRLRERSLWRPKG